MRAGVACRISGTRPEVATRENTVRASLLRLLITGATPGCGTQDYGVGLVGGWVTGRLDLSFARARGRTLLDACHFVERPMLPEADLNELSLDRSYLPGLSAEGMRIQGNLLLNGVTAKGTVDLNGAKIGGRMACDGATLEGPKIDGKQGMALIAQRLDVVKSLFWRKVTVTSGTVTLAAARVGDLVDDGRWPDAVDVLRLDGFTYDRIVGADAPVTAAGRQGWLRAGSVWKGRFLPQPYTQLARVFRSMGLSGEARTVLYWREGLVARQARWEVLRGGANAHWWSLPFRALAFVGMLAGDIALRWVAGYGYRPLNGVIALALLCGAAFWVADRTWHEGQFAPNSDVVLTSDGWRAALARDCVQDPGLPLPAPCVANPAEAWSGDPLHGMDWESFSPWGYALDLVVPILDLGQTDAWAPSKDRGWWGFHLWYLRWVFAVAGWLVTALGAAAVTGIMQRDRE